MQCLACGSVSVVAKRVTQYTYYSGFNSLRILIRKERFTYSPKIISTCHLYLVVQKEKEKSLALKDLFTKTVCVGGGGGGVCKILQNRLMGFTTAKILCIFCCSKIYKII